ncbi:hypothetical protein [Streptomyces sp. SID3343]|uniref:hypothetical protein n=1 Tax=Streptomyces sp. SID3343 TaxID=2690260 RepID=UPI001370709D|nr:hypothetical protein [Streptomyces sp. SID3343]MYW01286.1 hypothetical protein [Streptomyces sp. SID3343]
MSDNPQTAEPGPGVPGPAEPPALGDESARRDQSAPGDGSAPRDDPAPRDGRRLRLVTIVWTVLMAVAVVMIVLMLRS